MVKGNKIILLAVVLLAVAACAVIAADVAPNVQIHGYMQNRAYSGEGAPLELRSERLSLSAVATLPENSTAYAEIYYHNWAPSNGLYLESAYYDTAAAAGRVRVGKGRRLAFGIVPSYPNRKTTNYGLVAEAFTQDRIQGVQYVYQKDMIDASVDVQSGYRLGTRPIGDIPGDSVHAASNTVSHLAFRDANSGGGAPTTYNRKLAVSARLGGKFDKFGLKAGVSGYFGRLDDADLVALTTSASALSPASPFAGHAATPALLAGATSKAMNVWGPDFTYKDKSGILVQGEWYEAKVSSMKYHAWDAIVGWEPADAKAWKFYARYATQKMGVAKSANSLTWDPTQIQLSAVQPLRKGVWLQYEYEINTEKNGGLGSVKNNLGFVELFTGF